MTDGVDIEKVLSGIKETVGKVVNGYYIIQVKSVCRKNSKEALTVVCTLLDHFPSRLALLPAGTVGAEEDSPCRAPKRPTGMSESTTEGSALAWAHDRIIKTNRRNPRWLHFQQMAGLQCASEFAL